jgi:hypothetical protein
MTGGGLAVLAWTITVWIASTDGSSIPERATKMASIAKINLFISVQ